MVTAAAAGEDVREYISLLENNIINFGRMDLFFTGIRRN
jgi:hypothetical protein